MLLGKQVCLRTWYKTRMARHSLVTFYWSGCSYSEHRQSVDFIELAVDQSFCKLPLWKGDTYSKASLAVIVPTPKLAIPYSTKAMFGSLSCHITYMRSLKLRKKSVFSCKWNVNKIKQISWNVALGSWQTSGGAHAGSALPILFLTAYSATFSSSSS